MKIKSGTLIAAFVAFAASGASAHSGIQDQGRVSAPVRSAVELPAKPQVIEQYRLNFAPDACSNSGAANQSPCPTFAALSPVGKPVRVIKIYNVNNVTVCAPGLESQCRTTR